MFPRRTSTARLRAREVQGVLPLGGSVGGPSLPPKEAAGLGAQGLPFLEKVARYRVFSDEKGLMNKSLLDVSGDLLIVSQFTLAADTKKGLRPSFPSGLPIEEAEKLYDELVRQAKKKYDFKIEEGRFGSEMDVSLINAGPATFILDL